MSVHFYRLLGGKPLLAAICIVSEQLLLLRVHRYNRHPCRQSSLHLCVDVTELPVAIRMVRAFFGLAVALQAEALSAQKLCHLLMTYWMFLPSQMCGQIPSALHNPSQGRLWIAPCSRFDQTLQRGQQIGIVLDNALSASSRPANTTRHCNSGRDLVNAIGYGLS